MQPMLSWSAFVSPATVRHALLRHAGTFSGARRRDKKHTVSRKSEHRSHRVRPSPPASPFGRPPPFGVFASGSRLGGRAPLSSTEPLCADAEAKAEAALIAWVKRSGGSVHDAVGFAKGAHGQRLVVTTPVRAGEGLISISPHYNLSSNDTSIPNIPGMEKLVNASPTESIAAYVFHIPWHHHFKLCKQQRSRLKTLLFGSSRFCTHSQPVTRNRSPN
jgi:hypothetical protein